MAFALVSMMKAQNEAISYVFLAMLVLSYSMI